MKLVHRDIQGAKHGNLDRHYAGVGYVLVEPDVTVKGDLYLAGGLSGTTLTVGGDAIVDGDLTLVGDLTVGGSLFVRGDIKAHGAVWVKGKLVSHGVRALNMRAEAILNHTEGEKLVHKAHRFW